MDGDTFYRLVNQPKQTYKVERCLLLVQTQDKKLSYLTCVHYTFYTYVNADMYGTFKSLCIFFLCFQNKWTRHQQRQIAQEIRILRTPLLKFSQNSLSKIASKLLVEMIQPHRIIKTGLKIYSTILSHTETKQKLI